MPTPPASAQWSNGRRIPNLAAAIAAVALITGCGSTQAGPPSSAGGNPAVRYAQCMRSHGVPSFPDPSPGQPPRIPSVIDTQAPAFRVALQACAKLLPGGTAIDTQAGSGRALLELARCMRAHGVPTFPDPTTSPPSPEDGNALGGPGDWLSLGTSQERQSPAYTHAAAVCGSPTS